jgi:hypothetical protein
MPFKYAVLHDLDETPSQPAGLAVDCGRHVLVEVQNGTGMPWKYDGPFEVLSPDSTRLVYRPGDEGYFEQVLIDLSRVYAIGEQDEIEQLGANNVLSLLAEKVLRPRDAAREADYPVVRWAERDVCHGAMSYARDSTSARPASAQRRDRRARVAV